MNPSTIPTDSGYVATRDGIRLYYECRGEGEPLLFINNFFMTATQWRSFSSLLSQKYRVIHYDLRHQGQSSRVESLSIDDHVEDVQSLLDHLGLASATLVGTCISTWIALEFALKHAGRVKGLVLCGPVINPHGYTQHKALHRSLLNSLSGGGVSGLFDHYYPLLYTAKTIEQAGAPGYLVAKSRFIQNNPPEQLKTHLETSVNMNFDCRRLKKLDLPILFLAGEDDFLSKPSNVLPLIDECPNARAEFIKNAGHNPYIETPGAFQSLINEFVQDRVLREEFA